MLNKTINGLLVLTILLTLAPMAFAEPPQEQVIHHEIGASYFDIWLHGDGKTWQDTNNDGSPDIKGQTDKTTTQEYTLPDKLLQQYDITRIEVTKNFNKNDYNDGKTYSPKAWGISWEYFLDDYLRYIPDNLSVQKLNSDTTTGSVTAEWTLDLATEQSAFNLKKYHTDQGEQFTNAVEGWRWYLPIMVTWYGTPKAEIPNLMVDEINPGATTGEATPGTKYTAKAKIINESNQSFTDVPVGAWNNGWKANIKDESGNLISKLNFGPKETKTINIEYTAQENKSVIKVAVDTPPLPDTVQESTEDDNVGEVEVLSKALTPPQKLGGDIEFNAVSQDGSITRPTGTAKWTDQVTATISPDAPSPPRGSLTGWSITSATLTIPRKNSDFTFGNPLPPRGTKKINMSTGGHTSSVTFEQDWGMDGAKIFNQITKQLMAERPRNYPITANYNIDYTYEYQVKHRSCSTNSKGKRSCHTWYETKTGSGSTSGTLSGNLYVNGAGVNSRAQ